MFVAQTRETITEAGLRESSARMVPAGTVLMTSRATIGYTAVATVPLATNQGFANLTCGERLVPEYVAHWLGHRRDCLIQLAGGTTFKELPKSTLKGVRIPLPPLDEQLRIVAVLNRAAKIERLRGRAEQTLRELIPALFIRMFGDPLANPKGWRKARLGEVCDIQSGLQVTKRRAAHPLTAPYLRVANVLRNELNLDEIKSIRLNEKELERIRLQAGDLLVVEGHGNAAEVGRAAVWDGSVADCVHQNHLIRARPDESVLLPSFANAYLNSSSGRQHLLREAKTTSGLNTITTSSVSSSPVFVPPIELQATFAKMVSQARRLTTQAENARDKAAMLFESLMPRLLGVQDEVGEDRR